MSMLAGAFYWGSLLKIWIGAWGPPFHNHQSRLLVGFTS